MSNGNGKAFTPTETRILSALADGMPHPKAELKGCVDEQLALVDDSALRAHLARIRKKLRPKGQDIICELLNRSIHWRHVRLLPSAVRG